MLNKIFYKNKDTAACKCEASAENTENEGALWGKHVVFLLEKSVTTSSRFKSYIEAPCMTSWMADLSPNLNVKHVFINLQTTQDASRRFQDGCFIFSFYGQTCIIFNIKQPWPKCKYITIYEH